MPNWYYSVDNKVYGPVPDETLKRIADESVLYPHHQVCKEGTRNWVEAKEVKGLFSEEILSRFATTQRQREQRDIEDANDSRSFRIGTVLGGIVFFLGVFFSTKFLFMKTLAEGKPAEITEQIGEKVHDVLESERQKGLIMSLGATGVGMTLLILSRRK
jgi:hypothetical protein